MSEEKTENQSEETETQEISAIKESTPNKKRGGVFTRRNGIVALASVGILFVGMLILLFAVYRFGYVDSYIKDQFIVAFDEMGVTFSADKFNVSVNPLQMTLENATFKNKKTGEKIARIGTAKFDMSVLDLYAFELERHVSIDYTNLDDLEVWINFKENGESNFDGIEILPPKNAVKFEYASAEFSITDGLIHFGDVERKISGNAKNVRFFLTPADKFVPDDQKRYKFDLTSTKSDFVYDDKKLEPIDIQANGILDGKGAEIANLKLTTPLGDSTLSGTVKDWNSPKYDLKIKSTVDLKETATVFPMGTAIHGIGNFEGTVTGEGEDYKVVGEVTSESLSASNIRLKALKINATVNGEGSIYRANGKAIAELLTFEDFRVEFPQMVGNIRGTGTDFRWFGELKAAAAKSPLGTIGGLYINDAFAEYKHNQLVANFGNFNAKKFTSSGAYLESIQSKNIRILSSNGVTDATIPNITANKLEVEGATLERVNISDAKIRNRNGETEVIAGNVRAGNVETEQAKLGDVTAKGVIVKNKSGETDVKADSIRAENVQTQNARLKGVTVSGVTVQNRGNSTNISARNLQTDGIDTKSAKIEEINATGVNVNIQGDTTSISSENVRIAKVNTNAAILGNLNVAGVRLTIRQGKIEGTSADFNAGDVDLRENGKLENVSIYKPVFVLEPSGRYRASLDMSLGGGVLGSVKLGKAKAQVVAQNDQIELNNLTAEVMNGKIDGNATIALNNSRRSDIKANFANLDLSKLLALQGGRVIPIEGKTNGKADLNFAGTDFRRASGTFSAEIEANAGTEDRGFIPMTGKLDVKATNGLFNVEYANLNTEKSSLNAVGQFDLGGNNSNLTIALNSNDAREIERIVRVLNLSPELEHQLDTYRAEFAGNFVFNGNLQGNISDPTVNGRASLDTLMLRGRILGAMATNISVTPSAIELRDGILQERDGGNLAFNVTVPSIGANNISVRAKLNGINTGNLLSALPISSLPDFLKNLQARASGDLNLSGLPNQMQGEANIVAKDGSVNGQSFDNLEAKAVFEGSLINVEKFDATFGTGFLNTKGFFRTDTTQFDFDAKGTDIPVSRILALFPKNESVPKVEGDINLTAKATGRTSDTKSYNVNFKGVGQSIIINDYSFGNVTFDGKTENQVLQADVVTRFQGQTQNILANVNFADSNLPLRVETIFNKTRLAPYIALVRKPERDSVEIDGTATGVVILTGNLSKIDSSGIRKFTAEDLNGTASFSQFDLKFDETPLIAKNQIDLEFDMNAVELVNEASFSGGGSNLTVSGRKAFSDNAINNLALNGKINLRILNALSENIFFSGLADVGVRLTGSNKTARLNGTGRLQNGSASTFIGSQRITFERLRGNILFTTNQIQVEQVTGFLGGGRVSTSGGVLLSDSLKVDRFRFQVRGNNIVAPLPKDFITTGNADIEISGRRKNGKYHTFITGQIIASRSLYRKDIDLADLIGGRTNRSITTGSGEASAIGSTNFDVRIIGRNALVVRNNLADLTASADLRVTGDLDFPQISGRITGNSGTLFFRDNRYEVQRGVLTFPPNTNSEPIINLQVESQIKGYQVFINLNGPLSETESFNASYRSNPSLPQPDIASLITTGNLSDSDRGLLGQGGVNTAAEVLTDEIINKPIAKATDKLFGLNRFELDPIISGTRGNPTARLTVGRQINKNLLVTYSTNLSEDQNQVLALEYRVSNRLSFVAQYEQRSLSNVTQQRNTFSFEIRLKKRF